MKMNSGTQAKDCMLIIDDDFINREILKNMFSSQYRFLEAENGLEGLHVIESHLQDICAILLDVDMPVMNGMELLKELHQRGIPSRVPIFLITSNEELDVAKIAYDIGVVTVIRKPVVPFIAMRQVQLLVELFRTRDALDLRVAQQEQKLQENVVTIDTLHRNTLEALASAIEFRDVESGEHTNRIYGITKILLRDTDMGAGLSQEDIENIAIGSIMHDVGKIAISDVILNKPGKLTHEEFEIMKTHTVKGANLLEKLSRMQNHPSYQYAMDIARHHHERWDGRGYPDGLAGNSITVWSQVTSIADVYDALVSPRVYKKAFSPDKAVQMILNGECGTFNPKLIDCFLQAEPTLRSLYIQDADIQPSGQLTLTPIHDSADSDTTKSMADVLLLTAAVQSAYDMIIGVNLTKNTFYMISYDRFLTHCAKNDGVFDDLITAGALSIPLSHRQQFIDAFSRPSLLQAFADGQTSVSLDHPQYTDDGRLMDVSTTVLFTEDPRNGDILEITLSKYRGSHASDPHN